VRAESVNTETLPADFQTETTEMQCWYTPQKYSVTRSTPWLLNCNYWSFQLIVIMYGDKPPQKNTHFFSV
jgi:hypothetical protein